MRVEAVYNMSMRRTRQLAGMEKGVHVLSQDSFVAFALCASLAW